MASNSFHYLPNLCLDLSSFGFAVHAIQQHTVDLKNVTKMCRLEEEYCSLHYQGSQSLTILNSLTFPDFPGNIQISRYTDYRKLEHKPYFHFNRPILPYPVPFPPIFIYFENSHIIIKFKLPWHNR